MLAIKKALLDGTIDCIASHHLPQHWDNKTCEFEYAKYGMIGLETMFAVLMECGLSYENFVQMQTVNIRNLIAFTHTISGTTRNIWPTGTAYFATSYTLGAYASLISNADSATWYQLL